MTFLILMSPSGDTTKTDVGIEDVSYFLRTRTKTQGGREAGVFNPKINWDDGSGDGTRPTREQVQAALDEYVPTFASEFGVVPDGPDPAYPNAIRRSIARLAALGVALEIELSYFPEQVASGRSPYDQLRALFDSRKSELLAILGLDSDGDGTIDPGSRLPSYGGFPTTGITVEGAW